MRNKRILLFLLAAVCLLSGCSIRRVEELYCLPRRSDAYLDLQSVMDGNMGGLAYCAPLSGENRQTVQTADLDGDGQAEYLLFTRDADEALLKILIFRQENDRYSLIQTVSGNGGAFDLVEYAQMDGQPGLELIVGRQLSDQVLRSVSVYSLTGDRLECRMTAPYTKFLSCDLDGNGQRELLVLGPGEGGAALAELYSFRDGAVERSREVSLSGPGSALKRILLGRLHGGSNGVFVASSLEESAIITDVLALVDGQLTNVSLSADSGTSVQTLRNYDVYAEDINGDGEVELPALMHMMPLHSAVQARQHLIRWYAMAPDGTQADKLCTFHDFGGGWYMELDQSWAQRVSVVQEESAYHFYLWDEGFTDSEKIFTVYALSGQDREEQAIAENRFVLLKSENLVYAARMEVASGVLEITQADLMESFHLIRRDWNTGEM